ncbi:MAG: glycosyltransferase family 39 protein [Anaerolineaceae bacterium]
MSQKVRLFISLLACLIPGAVFTFLFLPHFHWYWRRSATVQLILKGGLFIFFSLVAFLLIYLVWRWVDRVFSANKVNGQIPSLVDLIAAARSGIKNRLPDLATQNEGEPPTLSSRFPILVLSIIPIILALINQEWLFTRAGEVDPWAYVSLGYYYFRDPALSNGYKISRVPWVLIESLIRNLFTPTASAIILTLTFAVLGAIGFYLLVSRFFGKANGFITAALLATYSYYMVSRSSDYHNTVGGVFLIWSLYFLTLAIQAKKNQPWWFIAFGATYGIAVHSELVVLGCLPAMVVQFFTYYWCGKKRPIVKAVLFSLVGFLSVTALLGLAALLSGRSFFFFMPQLIKVAFHSESLSTQPGNFVWALRAKHLALPVAVFLFSAGWIVINVEKILLSHLPISRRVWFQLSINLQMTLVGIIWLAGEIFQKDSLSGYHLVHPVYIYTFLAFAGFLAMGQQVKISPFILGLTLVAVCSSLAFSDQLFSAIESKFLPVWQIVQPLLFYLFVLACLALLKNRELVTLVIVILMSLGNVMGMFNGGKPSSLTPAQFSLDNNQCHLRKDGYLSVIDTFQQLWGFGWSRTHIWWDSGEMVPVNNCPETQVGLNTIGLSVTRTGIQQMYKSRPSVPVGKIPAVYYRQLSKQDDVVAVLTNNPSTVNQMLAKLRTYGNWSLARQDTILEGDIRFSLYVLSLDGKIR